MPMPPLDPRALLTEPSPRMLLRLRSALILATFAVASCLGTSTILAQGEPAPLETAAIEERIAALEAAKAANGEDAEQNQAIAVFQEALALAKDLQASATAADDFVDRSKSIPDQLAETKAQSSALDASEQAPAESSDTGLDESTSVLETLRPKLKLAREKVTEQLKEEDVRRQRLELLPGIIAKAKSEVAALATPPTPLASATALEKANYERLVLRRALLGQQIAAREAELQFYRESAELFSMQVAATSQRFAALETSVEAWQKVLDRRRLASTSAAAKRAEQDVERYAGNAAAQQIATESAALAAEHGGEDGLSQKMSDTNDLLSDLEQKQDRVSKQVLGRQAPGRAPRRADLGLDATTGRLLRQQRQKLPDARLLREQLREAIRQSAQAQIDLIRHENRQAVLLGEPKPDENSQPKLATLHAAREDQLSSLIRDSRIYVNKLSDAVTKLRNLYGDTLTFSQFIDERLLWIPSTHPISLDEPKTEAASARELFTKENRRTLPTDIRGAVPVWLGAGIALAFLLLRRRTFRSGLVTAGEIAQKRNCTSFVPTAKAIAYSLLLAVPIPAIAWFIYSRSAGMTPGVLEGFLHVAGFLTFTILFKVIAHPHGLMVDHFRISPERVGLIRAHLRWFIPLMVPYIFFAISLPLDATDGSAGRLFFIGVLVVLSTFCCLLFRPSKQLILWRGKAPNLLSRTCFAFGIAAPAILILGAATGYFASVQELRMQCMMSISLILAALFIAAILYRLILVSRRRLAVNQALERRAAAVAQAKQAEHTPVNPSKSQRIDSQDDVKAAALSVVEVGEQTSRLVRATTITLLAFGLWGIWKPTIPALSALDKITLWNDQSANVAPAAATPEPEASAGSKDETDPGLLKDAAAALKPALPVGRNTFDSRITLQDLAASLIALLLTFVAARNIPGLLELTILRRLRLPPGSSFAFTTTIRYFIVVTGVILALGMIGITWGKVQFIAAAITLGIGFGLQEIFANFVAGLIILFERPIRLGDVVTVGDVSGKVSQIRIRATTIRQFNSRELIVPNKEFITGKLVNWTLSDSMLRLEIMVGIAYGSDTKLASEILSKVAAENGRVLKEPEPDVLFEDFADSSLLFQLRAHVGNVDDLIPARTSCATPSTRASARLGSRLPSRRLISTSARSQKEQRTPPRQ